MNGEKTGFLKKLGSVKAIISLLILAGSLMMVIVTQIVNAYVQKESLTSSAEDEIRLSAKLAADTIDEWVDKQFQIAVSIKDSLEYNQGISDDYIENYLELRLAENEDAQMYYIGYASDKILCANHEDISGLVDIDQSEYWTKAMKNNSTVFTEPYKDVVSGKMMVSIGCPVTINGTQAVIIEDITIDNLGTMVNGIMDGEHTEAFLINENHTIIVHGDKQYEPTESGNTTIDELLSIDLNSTKVMEIDDVDGEREYLALGKVESSGWTVGVSRAKEAITSQIDEYTKTNVLASVIFLLIALPAMYIFISKKLAPVGMLDENLQKIANGDLSVSIARTNRKDDVGGLQNSTAGLVEELSGIIKDVSTSLSEISSGNLTIDDIPQYTGDYGEISKSVNSIKNTLSGIMQKVSESANTVGTGSSELTDATASLAQSTTEQASSVQNIADEINEIAQKVNQNLGNCNVIQAKLQDFEQLIGRSNENMTELAQNVTNIEDMSKNIQSVVDSIDSIAFQTNILALNASVEAARAGEHGMGFAVVAEEVGNLAGKSAEESKRTDEMIGECIKAIRQAKEKADKTMDIFEKIVENSNEISKAFAEILEATDEQAKGTDSIRIEIGTVSDVIQTTTATTEQTAAATEALSEQASAMNEIISRFRLNTSSQVAMGGIRKRIHL